MPDVGVTRKFLTSLLKGVGKFGSDAGINYNYATVDVKGSGDVENIGLPLMWSESDSAFIEFVPNADWAASTTYTLLDVVKPITQNGYEYVCVLAGDSDAGEPTWPTVPGMTETETAGVVWLCRNAYAGNGNDSPLPTKAHICVTTGTYAWDGENQTDTTLSSTAVKMRVIYRGEGAVVKEGFEWGDIVAADQAEFYAQLEKQGLAVIESATTVDPSMV